MNKLFCAVLLTLVVTLNLYAARITRIEGKPEVLSSISAQWHLISKSTTLNEKDRIRCGTGSRLEILLASGHRIKMWPKSEISIEKINAQESKINLMLGRLRSWVKKLKAKEKFEVKTPVAVCSVRGTDFTVEVGQDNQTTVQVYEGTVAAKEETTGQEVLVRSGEFTQIQENQPPSKPENLPEERTKQDEGAKSDAEKIREEAKNEIFQEISREAVLDRAAEEIKLAEYQNGKAVIDASGSRLRLEEYIVRTQPNEFKYVVLNTREDRFDFGKIVFTFNDTLPEDLTLATKTMFYSEGLVKPEWWLTDVLSVMSNTIDQVNEQASGGEMFADNPQNPASWTLGFANYKFSINNNTWWDYADTNSNGRVDSGEISYYNITSGAKISFSKDFNYDSDLGKYYLLDSNNEKVYFSDSSQPSGPESFHFYQKNNYGLDQWVSADDYIIDDSGKILTVADMNDKTSSELEKMAYESNFERIYASSVFEGRKIDLVFSAKLLIDAGILNLPEPTH